MAGIADLLPVRARLRWDVPGDGSAAIPAEHPVAAAADPACRRRTEVGAMVTVLRTGGRTASRPASGPRFARALAETARGVVR